MRDITAELKPYVSDIIADCDAGHRDAENIIKCHRMHCATPNDPGAYAICCAAFDDWKKRTGKI